MTESRRGLPKSMLNHWDDVRGTSRSRVLIATITMRLVGSWEVRGCRQVRVGFERRRHARRLVLGESRPVVQARALLRRTEKFEAVWLRSTCESRVNVGRQQAR